MSDIKKLKERYNEVQKDIDADRESKNRRKRDDRFLTAFLKLPGVTEMDFFCDNCLLDFHAPAYKSWSHFYEVGAWQSFCPLCERPVCRWISDKANDPYYEKSSRIRSLRSEFEADTLQPEQYGFRTLYGDPFEKYGNLLDLQEQEIRSKYLEMGLSGETLKEKDEREAIKEYFDR